MSESRSHIQRQDCFHCEHKSEAQSLRMELHKIKQIPHVAEIIGLNAALTDARKEAFQPRAMCIAKADELRALILPLLTGKDREFVGALEEERDALRARLEQEEVERGALRQWRNRFVAICPTHGGRGSGETTMYAGICSICHYTVEHLPSNASGRRADAIRGWNKLARIAKSKAGKEVDGE